MEKPIQGHGHFMISKGVSFDDNFDSTLVTNLHTFRGGLNLRSLGNGHVEPLELQDEERTGNATQIDNTTVSEIIQQQQEKATNKDTTQK